jgi:hypothetical protein
MPPRDLSENGLDLLLTDIIVWPVRVTRHGGQDGRTTPVPRLGFAGLGGSSGMVQRRHISVQG